ncbi:PIN domain-containing protein [Cellvibrio polysaccharolyticus]|uniref:DUF4935 domain-containing protein n=1 Tax=Cellvibrio polysaccharolyticus TaxID=2082724 RepID=A0A928UZ76_9GAMM|nr:PIN domain-containing protein [Cellvibrio polysaccharolyticus]MBE8715763.1 hypothetical protein [Cellvibrio polysaccharolyticus]
MDESIPLILDSSVFRQVPKLNSQLFKEIVKYTRVGIYKIYIPEIVEKEYISWIKGEAQSSYDNVVKATQLLHKYYESPKILGFDFTFNATASIAANEINGILKKVINNWNDFKVNTNASIIPILPEHGKLVMDAYFDGATPFDKIKNRVDIPDAFIYFGIKEILNISEKVVFVTGDKRFSEKLQGETILCFDSLSDLFSSGPAKLDGQYFNHLNSDDRSRILLNIHKEYILNKLSSELAVSELADVFSGDLIDHTIGKYHDYSFDINNLSYLVGDIKNISDSSLLVPFSANIICSIKSTASKVELSSVDAQRLVKIEREVDDGEFNLCEKYETPISGHFSVTFQDGDPTTWKEEKQSDSIFSEPEIKEISLALEDLQANA